MLTGKGIRYMRNFIGESAAEVGFHVYVTKQTVSNLELEKVTSPSTVKVITDYLISKFNDIPEEECNLRGTVALSGYNCGTSEFLRLKRLMGI